MSPKIYIVQFLWLIKPSSTEPPINRHPCLCLRAIDLAYDVPLPPDVETNEADRVSRTASTWITVMHAKQKFVSRILSYLAGFSAKIDTAFTQDASD